MVGMNEGFNPGEPEKQVDDRAAKLIHEFHDHYRRFAEEHPELAEKKREIFEAWAIQKIAGLQLSVEHTAEVLNRHIEGLDV